MLYPLVESCLPDDVIRVWERSYGANSSLNSESENRNKLESLMKFLRNEVEGEERISMAKSGFCQDYKNNKPLQKGLSFRNKNIPTAVGMFSANQNVDREMRSKVCSFCEKAHESKDCRIIQGLSLKEKRKILAKNSCCFICFKVGHTARYCRVHVSCSKCHRRHYLIMCPEVDNESYSNKRYEDRRDDLITMKKDNVLANRTCAREVLLQTLYVRLRGRNEDVLVRALIDSGSQRSYISKTAAARLGYEPVGKENVIHNLFGCVESSQKHFRYKVSIGNLQVDYELDFEVLDQANICADIPKIEVDDWEKELEEYGIILTDQKALKHGATNKIHVLIGADIAGKLMTGKVVQLNCGLSAIETRLGWTLMGKMTSLEDRANSSLMVLSLHVNEAKISDLWSLDTLGILDPAEKKSKMELEDEVREHYLRSVTRDSSGRYEVSLPWVDGHPNLPNNRLLAEKRLKGSIKSLNDENLLKTYEEVLDNWLEEGIIEKVFPTEKNTKVEHYLPHRAVVKENSTTRIRPVFDGSARLKGSVSLNDCLHKGPNLVELIPAVMNRFRLHEIGVIADIRKAFLQIGLKEQDRDFLRFLWWEEGDPKKLQIYRHCRVVFGISSSPFLLGATLSYHLGNAPSHLIDVANKLKESMYVDNCVASVESEEQLRKFIAQSKEIMMSAKFDLRGWRHNEFTSVSQRKLTPVTTFEDVEMLGESVSVLGLMWNLKRDTLCCDVKGLDDVFEGPVTKRKILSEAHKIFDPVGFSCPVLLCPKLLLQECWKMNISWDAELPETIGQRFRKWRKQIAMLNKVEIPRCFMGPGCSGKSLHVFCDASHIAYAACVFLRVERGKDISCQLVQARARVAPLKLVTIPRLELMACCIGARLCESVKSDLRFESIPTFYWSDSMNALYWIKREESWATFVFNRVAEIRKLTDPDNWRHVAGTMNPADLPSRGCSLKEFISNRWWEGPEWLKKVPDFWPKAEILPCRSIVDEEKRKTVVSFLNSTSAIEDCYFRISSYHKLVRVFPWIYRFFVNAKSSKVSRIKGHLNANEIKEAELKVLKQVQNEAFPEGIDKTLKALQPVVDEKGIIRVKTRILLRDDNENFRIPILLPSKHPVVTKLIEWKHKELGHAGVQILMCCLRENYWILRSRKTVRQVIRNCVTCQRFTASHPEVEAAPLPVDRVKDTNLFEVTGVDLAGPLVLKGGQKAWIVLFTCAVYRAIHLELVTSLSTECFLQALRRFIARRGRPYIIYSDNGTNFSGANAALKGINWSKVLSEATVNPISWKFIPPAAPWWGGWWERLIGMVKQILRRVLGRASLQYEELNTILCDCESTVNSRPLTYVSEDVEDLTPLTPAMFLHEIKEMGVPDIDHLGKTCLKKRYAYRQKIREDLRKRFRTEYLGQLRQSARNARSKREIEIGDLVLIGSDNIKRLEWPLARVTEIFPGKDGLVRVVKVRTRSGEHLRPIQRLYPLELNSLEGKTLRDASEVLCKTPDVELKNFNSVKSVNKAQQVVKESKTKSGRLVRAPTRLGM